jgi:hypothetical protein
LCALGVFDGDSHVPDYPIEVAGFKGADY